MTMGCRVLGGLITVLMVSACQRERSPEQRLQEARQSLEETRRDAQAEMAELQRRAAERKAEMEQELATALAEQQRRITQAEQEWQREQRAVAEYFQQETGASVATLGGAGAVQGRIVSTEPDGFSLRDEQGRTYSLGIDERTQVTQNQQPVSLGMYTEGTEVRASFIVRDDEALIAREVEILPMSPPAPAR
ncbi:hypothetical protein JQX13_26255 [Archangium violaceum]|uniref:hypothetical protein n=1 Tax=Archangium violaceum TaxID=83451 RepID=UPI00193C0765|nr:hypothetical protein [Archangium violaceum]QRK13225.1 hypothetical protein JQX13_26255 [Archangium violaceum]